MKVIVAGSRDITDARTVSDAIHDSGFTITEVVSGTARGADKSGEQWARYHGIPVRRFLPEWDKFGRSAGPRRNEKMAQYADALIAVWDGESRGTGHMIRMAKKHGLKCSIHYVKER